jgi:hypothetical protein
MDKRRRWRSSGQDSLIGSGRVEREGHGAGTGERRSVRAWRGGEFHRRGLGALRAERVEILGPGDIFFISPEEWHFHGGDEDSPMTHVAINGGGPPEWGEAVAEAEYDEGS